MTELRHKPAMPLFEPPARARRTDPVTSHFAAEESDASGTAKGQRTICLFEVMKHPGQTAAEIAEAVGLERHVPSRRLPELREMGEVENREVRTCKVMKSRCMTWWPGGGE